MCIHTKCLGVKCLLLEPVANVCIGIEHSRWLNTPNIKMAIVGGTHIQVSSYRKIWFLSCIWIKVIGEYALVLYAQLLNNNYQREYF